MERFPYEKLPESELKELKELGRLCRGDILKMTYIANSGHPGGSMSSIDLYLTVFKYAKLKPVDDPARDRIVISHGHTSPGVYAAMARLGFVDLDEVLTGFRHPASVFEGHVTRGVGIVDWTTGNLGQGLSAGLGFALASRFTGRDYHVFVLMSDAEQAKGQVAEARRVAKKYGVTNLTVIIDYNDAQISGRARDVMPVNIKENYLADGWRVIEIDGHDYEQIYLALKEAVEDELNPVAILAKTVMGKGVSFMENEVKYHGKPLNREELERALLELGIENDVDVYIEKRKKLPVEKHRKVYKTYPVKIDTGDPITYTEPLDNRGAFGKALLDLVKKNAGNSDATPIVAVDCDLKGSVKLDLLDKEFPERVLEVGVQEHNAAAMAGALSAEGVITFFADFGVFGISETYNQHRLNAINGTNLKVVVTHCGLNVGEDGKTHHGLDYISGPMNWYGFKVIVPGDPNQTDRAVRYAAKEYGNFVIAMGRSKLPIILDENGKPFFGEGYAFEYGKIDVVREGNDAAIVTYGSTLHLAVEAADDLRKEGIKVSVLNVSCPVDLDIETLKMLDGKPVLVVEDHNVFTGLGSYLGTVLLENGILPKKYVRVGVPEFAVSGDYKLLYKLYGLDKEGIVSRLKEML
ncbi:transketolase [Thermotoga neapolitana]|uniref:Transketolase n=1 Tax=Thermotoga neapolitana (strain ATCC 49049 / DSM 4359 / NBRC 107923 / NS-E) TaxID=309803 RepID=B9K845_THENN|nr:transketolase [Thermotoga neapolitana]ACM23128.1 Transketolase [Thermotoga neapolitana DSM 4359]KFZ21936.1 transketolase [Thermotoga neapolitana LA10]HBF11592.1 transketolase [Thermotoga neapolitana]